jgi:hypothetical protein
MWSWWWLCCFFYLINSCAQNLSDLWISRCQKKTIAHNSSTTFIWFHTRPSSKLADQKNFETYIFISIVLNKVMKSSEFEQLSYSVGALICKYQLMPAAFSNPLLVLSSYEQLCNCLLNFQFSSLQNHHFFRYLSFIPHPYFMNWE